MPKIPIIPRAPWHRPTDKYQVTSPGGLPVSYPKKPKKIARGEWAMGLDPSHQWAPLKYRGKVLTTKQHIASLRRIRDLSAKEKAKLAAEKKAEAAKLAALPPAQRRLVRYLKRNSDAFGCQRKHVLEVLKALTGHDFPSLVAS